MLFKVIVLDWRNMTRDERWSATSVDDETAKVLRAVVERGAFKRYEVEAEGLEDVFAILNRAPGYEDRVPSSYANERSLSTGDVVIDAAGVPHYCASVGWRPLAEIAPEAAKLLAA